MTVEPVEPEIVVTQIDDGRNPKIRWTFDITYKGIDLSPHDDAPLDHTVYAYFETDDDTLTQYAPAVAPERISGVWAARYRPDRVTQTCPGVTLSHCLWLCRPGAPGFIAQTIMFPMLRHVPKTPEWLQCVEGAKITLALALRKYPIGRKVS